MRFLLFAFLSLLVSPVVAQDWPKQRTIHIVVGFAPASTTDLVARLVVPKLSEALGQSVVVENKPAFLRDEVGKWAKAVKDSGAKAD